MKYLNLLILCLLMSASAVGSNYYFKVYDQKGFKATIQEIDRGANFSILQVNMVKGDAQGGPFSIVAAAASIGSELKKSHFTMISEFQKGEFYYYKIFFTSDTSEDPSLVFPNEMNQNKIDLHNEIGYLSVETYRKLFAQN